jgi:hypothetical protein
MIEAENRAHLSERSCGQQCRRNISLKRCAHRSNFTGGVESARKYVIVLWDRLRLRREKGTAPPLWLDHSHFFHLKIQ